MTFTATAVEKPAPEIVTSVPPERVPDDGVTDAIEGAGSVQVNVFCAFPSSGFLTTRSTGFVDAKSNGPVGVTARRFTYNVTPLPFTVSQGDL
ncbi:MAG TPA: hypothetical protein VGD79_12640, partial [Thermoanaerobaculia bacterium]